MECLKEISKDGYENEGDMFYARTSLDMLIRSTELAKTYYILESGKKMYGETPLLNCVEFVIEGLKA